MNKSVRRARVSTSTKTENKRVPETITTELVARLMNLTDSGFKTAYLKDSLLAKFVSKDTDPAPVRRARAIEKWLLCETNNADTNSRLEHLPWEYNILPRVRFDTFVDWVRSFIVGIIAETPPEDALLGSFSGGASTSRPRTSSHPALKFVGEAHITESALDWWETLTSSEEKDSHPLLPLWPDKDYVVSVVPGNVLFTVPKKTDIDRCACKEPDINMFLQKGVGNHFRHCLKLRGIDLNDQTRNKRLAREGSISNRLSTLDLSAASDSVTSMLVELVLPPIWFSLLNSLRCRVTIIDGQEHVNEMFSSMGNGFTFELESLLFYSLAKATAYFRGISGIISVYGDDIIVPSDMAHELISVLSLFGFTVNPDKTFIDGPFRESCGGHFYNGFDVTPFYIREPIVYLTDLIHVANQLREWSRCGDVLEILNPETEEIWFWLKDFVPEYLWGGHDTSFKYSLVTPDFPRKRLQAIEKKFETTLGGYYHWLSTTWRRETPSLVETSMRGVEQPVYRLRPSRHTVTRVRYVFLREI